MRGVSRAGQAPSGIRRGGIVMSRTFTSVVAPRGLWLRLAVALIAAAPSPTLAQSADHPPDKPIQVGTDFGIAPFVFRSPAGPEGFSVDMIREVARRIKRPGVEIADMNMSGLISALMSRGSRSWSIP